MDVIDSDKVENKISDSEEWLYLLNGLIYFSEQFYFLIVNY